MNRLLVADDDPTTLALLGHWARRWGYDVTTVADGATALAALEGANGPRLAVLDWQMPGCDGVEICRRLHRRASNAPYVHVILITCSTQPERIAHALDNGANDFLAKPLNTHEFKSRLGVGRRMLKYHEELNQKNARLLEYATELEGLAASRAKQLLHIERMATIGLLSSSLAHEVNNPTTFISGNAQTIRRFWQDVEPSLRQCLPQTGAEQRRKLEFVLDELPGAVTGILGGVKRIASIVRGLKTYAHQSSGTQKPCEVQHFIQSAIGLCGYELNKRQIVVTLRCDENLPWVHGDSQQLEQVVVNLIVNAAQAMAQSSTRALTVTATMVGSDVRISIEDTGPGIAADLLDRIWQPFFTTKAAEEGTGLGLSICRDIIEAHDGDIAVANRAEGGAAFVITLPGTGGRMYEGAALDRG